MKTFKLHHPFWCRCILKVIYAKAGTRFTSVWLIDFSRLILIESVVKTINTTFTLFKKIYYLNFCALVLCCVFTKFTTTKEALSFQDLCSKYAVLKLTDCDFFVLSHWKFIVFIIVTKCHLQVCTFSHFSFFFLNILTMYWKICYS